MGLKERIERFAAKHPTVRHRRKARCDKDVATKKYLEGVAPHVETIERARNIFDNMGVPAAQQGVYYAFVQKAQKLRKAALRHSGESLRKEIENLKAEFVQKGCDPAILDVLSKLVVGG